MKYDLPIKRTTEPRSLLKQIELAIQEAETKGLLIGFVACVVTQVKEPEAGYTYDACLSSLPVECSLWAAEKIKRRVIGIVEEHG